jgi:hypothetical protein
LGRHVFGRDQKPNLGLKLFGYCIDVEKTVTLLVRYFFLWVCLLVNPLAAFANEPPTISLEADSIAGYNAPADIVLTALPADVDGTISKVEFYSGSASTPLSIRTTPPYSHTVAGVPAGIYTYTAKVYDNQSAVTTSSPVSVTVSAALSPATFTYDELGRLIGVQH